MSEYIWNWGNIAILGEKNPRRAWHVIPAQEVKLSFNLHFVSRKFHVENELSPDLLLQQRSETFGFSAWSKTTQLLYNESIIV